MITIPIEIGDVILTGKFKNHKVTVKDIDVDEHGLPTVNGKGILKIRIEKLMNKSVKESTMTNLKEAPTSANDPKIQRIVDQINALIASAKDSDGDPLGVIDRTGTWEEPIIYEPLVYKNGTLKITTRKVYGTGIDVDFIKKSNMEYDGIPTLRNIMKMYKRAIKDNASGKNTNESLIKEASLKQTSLKAIEKKIQWGTEETLPMMQGEAIKTVIDKYKIPATEWGYSGNYIGVGTNKQRIFWKDTGSSLVFSGILNRDGTIPENRLPESKKNSKMTLSEVISKGVFVTIKKEDGKFWFYIDNNGEQECISNVGFPTKEAAEHAALTKGFNVEKGGDAEDELPETVEVPKPSKRETTKGTEKPKEIDLGKEKKIKLEQVNRVIREEIINFIKKYPKLLENLQKKNLNEAPKLTKKIEDALIELEGLQKKLSDAKAQIEQIKKATNYTGLEKRIDKILKEELWDFFEELKKDDTRIVQIKNIIMNINRFQAETLTYKYEQVLDFVMTQVNQDVKLKILTELKACETLGRTKGNVSFTQTEGIGDIWNSIKSYFQKLIPSLKSKGTKIDDNIQKLQNIVDKMK